jgi:predicted DNA-binding transcriptional regulator
LILNYREKQMVNYDLLPFLKDIGCSDMQFKLLCFWGRHPRAKLSLCTVARAIDTPRNNLRDAITALVNQGILVAQHNSNGLTTYTLSEQQSQEYISELARLDWSKMMNLGKQLKEEVSLSNERE